MLAIGRSGPLSGPTRVRQDSGFGEETAQGRQALADDGVPRDSWPVVGAESTHRASAEIVDGNVVVVHPSAESASNTQQLGRHGSGIALVSYPRGEVIENG